MSRILYIIIISLLIGSCYYDSEESLYPQIKILCDTTNVTFSLTIVPVLQNNCYSCHSNTTAASFGSNIRLQDYADVNAKKYDVLSSIKHDGTRSAMPKGGSKLKECSIRQFEIWINNGAPDN